VALDVVWEEQSEGDREILRCNKEVCGRIAGMYRFTSLQKQNKRKDLSANNNPLEIQTYASVVQQQAA
jgi:hypothetical protein